MRKELDNFIIESDMKLDYFNEIADYILKNEEKILNFFNLKKLPEKCKIKIMNYNQFKDYIIKNYGKVYNYMRGTMDGKTKTIRILNIEDQRKFTIHKHSTINSTAKMIMHEIVHLCNDYVNDDYEQTIWFREGLATNLSDQKYDLVSLNNCDFELLKNDFIGFGKGNYSYSYTIVYYLLNNYAKEEIEKLVSNSNYLKESSNRIFDEAKRFVLNEINDRLNSCKVRNL